MARVRLWKSLGVARFQWLEEKLQGLKQGGLLRHPSDAELREAVRAEAMARAIPFVDASSNDYLGYASRLGAAIGCDGGGALQASGCRSGGDVARETARCVTDDRRCTQTDGATHDDSRPAQTDAHRQVEAGAGASRLLGGTNPTHTELESALARWVCQDTALLFSSGYAANLGLLSAIAGPDDVILSDALNHASIIDGCRLSRAQIKVFPHRDAEALERLLASTPTKGQKLVVTESYFSMDADTPDLRRLRDITDLHDAPLIVDEAHALGVFGPRGSGLAALHEVRPDIVVGTLGKSVGLQGAFVAAPATVKTWLWNRARSFVYSTASIPGLALRALCHVEQVQADEGGRTLLLRRSSELRDAAKAAGLRLPPESHGPIVPILMGSPEAAIGAAEAMRANGVLAYPLRPPTVPPGTSRLRLTVSSGTSADGFAHLLRVVTRELPRLSHL